MTCEWKNAWIHFWPTSRRKEKGVEDLNKAM